MNSLRLILPSMVLSVLQRNYLLARRHPMCLSYVTVEVPSYDQWDAARPLVQRGLSQTALAPFS